MIANNLKPEHLDLNYLAATTTKKPYFMVTYMSPYLNLRSDYCVILVRHPCACWLVSQHSKLMTIKEYVQGIL